MNERTMKVPLGLYIEIVKSQYTPNIILQIFINLSYEFKSWVEIFRSQFFLIIDN